MGFVFFHESVLSESHYKTCSLVQKKILEEYIPNKMFTRKKNRNVKDTPFRFLTELIYETVAKKNKPSEKYGDYSL